MSNFITKVLRNAFSYAVHFESADDRDRKAGVAQKLIELSAPLATDTGADYEARLRGVLMDTRTKYLDKLVEKNVAVSLDKRINEQVYDEKMNNRFAIQGVFYPGPQGSATGGLAALWDEGSMKRSNAILLEKLGTLLSEGTPTAPVYGYTYNDFAITPDGGGAPITSTEWNFANPDASDAAKLNPALKNPPAKAGPAPN